MYPRFTTTSLGTIAHNSRMTKDILSAQLLQGIAFESGNAPVLYKASNLLGRFWESGEIEVYIVWAPAEIVEDSF